MIQSIATMIQAFLPLWMLLFLVFLTVVAWRSLSSRKSNTASAERPFEKKATTKEHKTCPFCKEGIKSDAVKCKRVFNTLKHKNTVVNLCKIFVPFFDIEIDIRRESC